MLGTAAGLSVIICALLLWLRRRRRFRQVAPSTKYRDQRSSIDTWIGTRLGESRVHSPAFSDEHTSTSNNHASLVAALGMHQTGTGTLLTHPGHWSVSSESLGHHSIFTSTPPNSSTQLIFPQNQLQTPETYSAMPSPSLPVIQVTGPAEYEQWQNNFAFPRLSLADSFVPLETPIDRPSDNPFVTYDPTSSFEALISGTQLEGSHNPFLALCSKRDSAAPSVASSNPFENPGVVLGHGSVTDRTSSLSHRATIASCKADVFFPPSPADAIDRFWDLPDLPAQKPSAALTSPTASSERLRAFSPGPTSHIDSPTC